MVAWFVSTPAVLMVKNFRGVRFWVYLGLGCCVGPLLMLALFGTVYLLCRKLRMRSGFGPSCCLSCISLREYRA